MAVVVVLFDKLLCRPKQKEIESESDVFAATHVLRTK
jgi:hypothetical protein